VTERGILDKHRFLAFITDEIRYIFKVNMVACNKITVLLDVTPSSLVDVDLRFGGSGCFNFQSRSLEGVRM